MTPPTSAPSTTRGAARRLWDDPLFRSELESTNQESLPPTAWPIRSLHDLEVVMQALASDYAPIPEES